MAPLNEGQKSLLATIRDFVNKEIIPVAPALEREDKYPAELVEQFKELGLFGATIPEKYGGLGLDTKTYALIIEEICRGKGSQRHDSSKLQALAQACPNGFQALGGAHVVPNSFVKDSRNPILSYGSTKTGNDGELLYLRAMKYARVV